MTTVVIEWRLGIGVDIEHNEEVCYFVHDDEEKLTLVQFNGLIINLPFIKIHIGKFYEVE
jgi:hypothetical protein